MHEEQKQEFSRRNLLRLAAAIPLGAAVAAVELPLERAAINGIESKVNIHAGNAGIQSEISAQCKNEDDPRCEYDYIHSSSFTRRAVITGPIDEEIIFRTVPSIAMDMVNEIAKDDINLLPAVQIPLHNAVVGTHELKTSRREMIVGLCSSLVFGAMHNITMSDTNKIGYDTHTLPAAQVMFGGVSWILQRKFGLGANLTAHMATNAIVLAKSYK